MSMCHRCGEHRSNCICTPSKSELKRRAAQSDTPELTPLERVWIADECPEGEACRGLFGFVGENAREGMTEYIRADLYAELEQAVIRAVELMDYDEHERDTEAHTLLKPFAIRARQGAQDEPPATS